MPKICGSHTWEYEIITSNIPGDNIVALYNLNATKINGTAHYYVDEVIKNPYIEEGIVPHYKVGDQIVVDTVARELYKTLCGHLPISNNPTRSKLYKNYDDFVEHYSEQDFAEAQKWLQDTVFARDLYQEESSALNGEVDLSQQCAIL